MTSETGPGNIRPKDLWGIFLRRRWWLLGPLFLIGWLVSIAANRWPYVYRSEALIVVEPQEVPEQYITPNVVINQHERVVALEQQILSRTHLHRLIDQYNLYPRERACMPIEDVIEKMRNQIGVEPNYAKGRPELLTSVKISYSAKSPRLAQQVTNALTSLLIEENLQARTQQSIRTTTFLENQLEDARKDLGEQERRQREYKMRYLGELPEQQQANLQILSSLETQLHTTSDSLDRAEQQRTYLETMREQYLAVPRSAETGPNGVPVSPAATAATAILGLQKELAGLEGIYTPQHPDIVRLKEKIAQMEALKQRMEPEQAQLKGEANTTAMVSRPMAGETTLIEVESRLKAVALEIRDRQKEMEALRERVREFQSRLSLTPVREQQLAEVTRAYENSRQNYQSLLQKKLQSELATNLEKRQQGEQFRIVDPANIPTKSVPNRLVVILTGWAIGLGVGVGLIAFLEVNDDTLHSEQDIHQFTRLSALIRIPVLNTPREENRLRWDRSLEVAGVSLLLVLSVGLSLYSYFRG